MKNTLLILVISVSYSLTSNAQIITTVAGNGVSGNTGDKGPATAASIGYPDGCAFDKNGNFYFTTVGNIGVRKVTPSGIISTIAGTISGGYNGDGIAATDAGLDQPSGIAIDKFNNVYIADGVESRIRKINAVTGIISTVAGNGTLGYEGDGGAATASILSGPEDICFDQSGNLYISDFGNFRIRRIDTHGIITTVAGKGSNGYNGDGGMATAAEIGSVFGICADKTGNLYITDNSNVNIRMINIIGIITTIAGNGSAGPSGDGGPATTASLVAARLVCDDFGNLFISGYIDNDVRVIDKYGIIHSIAGTGVYGFNGDGKSATAAELSSTYGIALDTCDNVYIADKDNVRIRKIALNPTCINEEVNAIKSEETISIYPNPTNDLLNINNIKTKSNYSMLSIIGTTIQQGTLKEGNNSISIQSIPHGMYMLEIVPLSEGEGQGEVKKVTKIIKQ